jgi:hypothetical protein
MLEKITFAPENGMGSEALSPNIWSEGRRSVRFGLRRRGGFDAHWLLGPLRRRIASRRRIPL